MILISHRGNVNGPNPNEENTKDYIKKAVSLGFEVEIDVWFINNEWYLGHNKPTNKINFSWINNTNLWCHAKNINALYEMINKNIHCFWHQKDDFTLTSHRYIWTYPGKKLTKNSICVLPEIIENIIIPNDISGICSDYIQNYKT